MQKSIIRIAIGTLCILIIPLLGNRFVEGWNWSFGDFIVMGSLIFGTGLFYELASRKAKTTSYRTALGIAVAAGFLMFWVNAAAGIIGSEDEFPSAMYPLVPLVGLIGTFIVRFKPQGMARAAFGAAFTQVLILIVALIFWRPAFDEPPGLVGVFLLNGIFITMFVLSGLLFRRAGKINKKVAIENITA